MTPCEVDLLNYKSELFEEYQKCVRTSFFQYVFTNCIYHTCGHDKVNDIDGFKCDGLIFRKIFKNIHSFIFMKIKI